MQLHHGIPKLSEKQNLKRFRILLRKNMLIPALRNADSQRSCLHLLLATCFEQAFVGLLLVDDVAIINDAQIHPS